jgi:hypothetical protein
MIAAPGNAGTNIPAMPTNIKITATQNVHAGNTNRSFQKPRERIDYDTVRAGRQITAALMSSCFCPQYGVQ